MLRLQRDIGGQSKAALVYTDRIDGASSNRVLPPTRAWCGRTSTACCCRGRISRTASTASATVAPLWQGTLARNGGRFGVRYQVRGVDPDFRAAAGFISRAGIVLAIGNAPADHQRQARRRCRAVDQRRRTSTAPGSTTTSSTAAARRIASCTSTTTSRFAAAGAPAVRCSSRPFGYDQQSLRRLRDRPADRHAVSCSCPSPARRGCRISTTCCR